MPKLNETFVKKIKPPTTNHKIHYDSEIPGFGIRATKSGTKSFILNYHINKRERRFTIGKFPSWTAVAAREKAKDLRRQVDQGIDPLEERIERREAPTVADLWLEYQRVHLPRLASRSQKDQQSMWTSYILPEFAAVAVRDLSSRQTDRLHANITMKAPTRANRVLEVFRTALNLGIRWGWIEKNPADGFPRNAEHSRERYLSPEEYELVFSALDKMPNQKAANAIRLIILTGARRGEVLGLEWKDVDLGLGIWNRPPHKSKDRKAKRIPFSKEALILLNSMHDSSKDNFLFPTTNGTPMPDLNRPWRWLRSETGLADIRIHDLRHSFASVLVSSGKTLETIGKLLGHSQYQTTMRYAHLMDDPLREAADSFSTQAVKRDFVK